MVFLEKKKFWFFTFSDILFYIFLKILFKIILCKIEIWKIIIKKYLNKFIIEKDKIIFNYLIQILEKTNNEN